MLANERTLRKRLRRRLPAHLDVVDLPHGVTVGDVTDESAVVWTRTADPAVVHVEYAADGSSASPGRTIPRPTDEDTDNTAKLRLGNLKPGTDYRYRVWALEGKGAAELYDPPEAATTGRFRTAPSPTVDDSISFVWTGDTYGQGRAPPYQVPRQMEHLDPDFFLYLGDTIYADNETPALPDGDPQTVDDYRAKYKEVRELGTNLRKFLQTTSVVPIWDDHEVRNDWGGTDEPLLPAARQAFFEYWPLDEHPAVTGDDENRLYRSFRWGKALELFVLDARQYRDDNTMPDGPEKTMLGEDQKEWLKSGLAETDATFAVVASGVSITSPSSAPDARDSWVDGGAETGFETELEELLEFVREEVDSTVVWLAGDRHFARFTSFDLDYDGRPDLYEAMAGPIGASPREPGAPDGSFDPLIHYEEGGKYELGEFYNFGHVEVTGRTLRVGVYDKVGDRRATISLDADGDGWPAVETRAERRDTSSFSELRNALKRSIETVSGRLG